MRFLVIVAVTIMCFGFIVEAGHIPYIPDKLLGKLAPPLLFLGGAYGTAAVGAVIGANLAKQKRHGGHGGMGGMGGMHLFAVHPGLQYGHVAPLNHQI